MSDMQGDPDRLLDTLFYTLAVLFVITAFFNTLLKLFFGFVTITL